MEAIEADNEISKVKEFCDRIAASQQIKDGPEIPSQRSALKFLRARKFDVDRAIQLYRSHEETRRREGLEHIDPFEADVQRELLSQKLTVLSGRDEDGGVIALFTAKLHFPEKTTHRAVLKALVFQLDAALENVDSQKNGLVFIYDMTGSKFANFEYDLSTKILNMLKGSYPARLKKVLIVKAPLWFSAPFNVLRLFVKEKLQDRVFTVKRLHLHSHIPVASLPKHLGGIQPLNHKEWLNDCLRSQSSTRPPNHQLELFFGGGMSMSQFDNMHESVTTPGTPLTDSPFSQASDSSRGTIPEKQNHECREKELEPNDVFVQAVDTGGGGAGYKRGSANGLTDSPDSDEIPALPRKKKAEGDRTVSIHGLNSTGYTAQELMTAMRTVWKRKGLIKNYEKIKAKPPVGSFNASKRKENLCKNRYTDVPSLDQTRVTLAVSADEPSDYVNANYVDSYQHKAAYISTQGPTPNTVQDFWRMIWEQQVLVIVMVTKTVERGRIKCHPYWPSEEADVVDLDSFTIMNSQVIDGTDYLTSTLMLTNTQTAECRQVIHMQFVSWPDYGVPGSASAFLNFLFQVRDLRRARTLELGDQWKGHPDGPPVVIHCSAGIGRSGTFIVMDILAHQLRETGQVDIEKTVQLVRTQRAFSVQMPDQYVFIHVALLEYALQEGILPAIHLDGFDDDSDNEM